MVNERGRNRPVRGKPDRPAGKGQAMAFEKLVGRAPQFRGLAMVAQGDEEELTASQEKFLNEFAVGLAKGVGKSGSEQDAKTEVRTGKRIREP